MMMMMMMMVMMMMMMINFDSMSKCLQNIDVLEKTSVQSLRPFCW